MATHPQRPTPEAALPPGAAPCCSSGHGDLSGASRRRILGASASAAAVGGIGAALAGCASDRAGSGKQATVVTKAAGPLAERCGVKTLVLSHLVPADKKIVSADSWRRRAQQGFRVRVVVGDDLDEVPLGSGHR
ncbi:hypothetical protein ACFC4G_10745 [Streptomyces sp. NPDC056002]|uniref:hypothetical protein n=1 Tax=Streptomyces sp. NPDC056002 TaxID=3345675 RepID=UPI0035DA8379